MFLNLCLRSHHFSTSITRSGGASMNEGQLWCGRKRESVALMTRHTIFSLLHHSSDAQLWAWLQSLFGFQLQNYGVMLDLSVSSSILDPIEMGH